MARKKATKPKSKRTTTTLSTTQKLEKEFNAAPAILAAQFTKEITALKQLADKLKTSLNKAKTLAQKAKTRAKSTAAAKTIAALSKQQLETAKALAAVSDKQAKIIAIRKNLAQFEKEWSKKSKQVKKAVAVKPKKKVVKKAASIVQLQQPAIETFDNSIDDVRLDETAEFNS